MFEFWPSTASSENILFLSFFFVNNFHILEWCLFCELFFEIPYLLGDLKSLCVSNLWSIVRLFYKNLNLGEMLNKWQRRKRHSYIACNRGLHQCPKTHNLLINKWEHLKLCIRFEYQRGIRNPRKVGHVNFSNPNFLQTSNASFSDRTHNSLFSKLD